MKKLTFVIALLLLSCRLFAQTTPTTVRDVSGIIKDASGNTISGAMVTLSDKAGDTLHTTTNADCIFALTM